MKKYDLEVLQKYIDDGWLEVQSHPTLPLKIYNYSRECAWEKKWDEITIAARGLILDEEGYVIAKGFNKFLNYEEYTYDQIPWDDELIYIQDKQDGSLGILFNYEDEWHFATRGSFHSDQAIKAMEILKKNHPIYNDELSPEFTYLFEIIYPENRIVLDYGKEEKLILLGINCGTQEINWENIENYNDGFFETTPTNKFHLEYYKDKEWVEELKSQNLQNQEGYVLRFSPSNFRMKVKFEEYVRLHSLMTQFSNVDIWKCLSTNTPIDLEKVPDEFDTWVKKTIKELRYYYMLIQEDAGKRYDNLLENCNYSLPDKRKYAEWVHKHPKHLQSILFKMYNGGDYSPILWKLVRPKYSKPFWKKDIDV